MEHLNEKSRGEGVVKMLPLKHPLVVIILTHSFNTLLKVLLLLLKVLLLLLLLLMLLLLLL